MNIKPILLRLKDRENAENDRNFDRKSINFPLFEMEFLTIGLETLPKAGKWPSTKLTFIPTGSIGMLSIKSMLKYVLKCPKMS